jgi:hypothetical protein
MQRSHCFRSRKKLIGWSLGIGVVSLAILVIINHFVPIAV